MTTHVSCTERVHVVHTADTPVRTLDPENNDRPFMRTTCANCGAWLSDGPYLDEGTKFPRLDSAGIRGAVIEGRRQLNEVSK